MDFLGRLLDALERESPLFLATIIGVTGSTPAPVLSRMIVGRDGKVLAGTLGGGCTENDIRQAAVDCGPELHARVLSFGLSEDHVELGPICGGSIDVLIEPLTPADREVYSELKRKIDNGDDALLATGLSEGGQRLFKIVPDEVGPRHPLLASVPSEVGLHILDFPEGAGARRWKLPDGEVVVEPFRGRPEAVIFGGGHIGQSVAHLAAFAGFRVTVVDDRVSFAHAERFPGADRTLVLPFDGAFESIAVTPSTYIVIVTRGHQHDEIVLRQAVESKAKYIGMIGSRRKVEVTFQHLREQGVSETSLRRVYSPIGIDIKAMTVDEIAVSVIAEMILVRRGAGSPPAHKRYT
jgi:xanthine dehydrogenase accessory factor